MADNSKDRGVTHIAAARIVRRYADVDASRLQDLLRALAGEGGELSSELIDRLIDAIAKAEAAGITRYQLSQRTGVPQSTLSRLMNRERQSLKVETLETLCRELGFTLEMRRTKRRA